MKYIVKIKKEEEILSTIEADSIEKAAEKANAALSEYVAKAILAETIYTKESEIKEE